MRPGLAADRRRCLCVLLLALAISAGGVAEAAAQTGPTAATKPTGRSSAPTAPITAPVLSLLHSDPAPPFSIVVAVPGAGQSRLGPIGAGGRVEPLSPWAMVP